MPVASRPSSATPSVPAHPPSDHPPAHPPQPPQPRHRTVDRMFADGIERALCQFFAVFLGAARRRGPIMVRPVMLSDEISIGWQRADRSGSTPVVGAQKKGLCSLLPPRKTHLLLLGGLSLTLPFSQTPLRNHKPPEPPKTCYTRYGVCCYTVAHPPLLVPPLFCCSRLPRRSGRRSSSTEFVPPSYFM